jgi:hypothetical protein
VTDEELLTAAGFCLAKAYGFDFAIQLEFEAMLFVVTDVRQSFLEALSVSSYAQRAIRGHVQGRLDVTIERTVEKLERRRSSLKRRRRVRLRTDENLVIDLGPEPTNENETLIMAGKMQDPIARELGAFVLLEHTGQIGLDGLIVIKRNKESLVQEAAAVEFEYQLHNFFQHRHPIRLADYIICWSVGAQEEGEIMFGDYGELRATLKRAGWMWMLMFEDHMIHVIALSEFPRIDIR